MQTQVLRLRALRSAQDDRAVVVRMFVVRRFVVQRFVISQVSKIGRPGAPSVCCAGGEMRMQMQMQVLRLRALCSAQDDRGFRGEAQSVRISS